MMSIYALAFAFAFYVGGMMFQFGAYSLKLLPTDTNARRLRTPTIGKNAAAAATVGEFDDHRLRGIGRSSLPSFKVSSSLSSESPGMKSDASRGKTMDTGTRTSSMTTVVTTRTIITTTVTTDNATSTSTKQTEVKPTKEAKSKTDTIKIGEEEKSAGLDHLRHHRRGGGADEQIAGKKGWHPETKIEQHRRKSRPRECTGRQKNSTHHSDAKSAEEPPHGWGVQGIKGNDSASSADGSREESKEDVAVGTGFPSHILLSNEAEVKATHDEDDNNGVLPRGEAMSATPPSPLGQASTSALNSSTSHSNSIEEDIFVATHLVDVNEQQKKTQDKHREKQNLEKMIEIGGQRDREKKPHRHRRLGPVQSTSRQRTRPHRDQGDTKSTEKLSEDDGMDAIVGVHNSNNAEGTNTPQKDKEVADEDEGDTSVDFGMELEVLPPDELESNLNDNSDGGDRSEGKMGSSSPIGGASLPKTNNATTNDAHGIGANSDGGTGITPAIDPVVVERSDECNAWWVDRLGDGFCDSWDSTYNTEECGWDGGDCCWQTCADGRDHRCGYDENVSNEYDCRDPRYSVYREEDEWDPQRRRDRRALRALYYATNGDDWGDSWQWLNTSLDHCYWGGIGCTGGGGYVWTIRLYQNHLNGTLPDEVGELLHLELLWLVENPKLHGTIPESFGNLAQLTRLRVSDTSLSGTIPASFGQLTQLTELDFGGTSLIGTIPALFGQLTQLTELDISGTLFDGTIPAFLGNLTQLTGLYLSWTRLSGTIPASFGRLTQLYWLDVRETQLTGAVPANLIVPIFDTPPWYYDIIEIPMDFWDPKNPFRDKYRGKLSPLNCTDVEGWLDANGRGCDWYANANASSCVAEGMEHKRIAATAACCSCGVWGRYAREREVLEVVYHATNGDEWNNQSSWMNNVVQHCDWVGIKCDRDGLVTQLVLPMNGLRGRLPTNVGDILQLETLDVSENQITGQFPTALLTLTNLKQLQMHSIFLSGTLPTQLASLSLLRHLDMSDNKLAGPIPQGLFALTLMEDLRLSHNTLTGTIAPEFRNMGRLKRLDIDHNLLWGTIPVEIGLLGHLRELRLSHNGKDPSFGGPIPVELGDLQYLEVLDLTENNFSDKLPTELGRLDRLQNLLLLNNRFEGYIPSEYGFLSNLQSLTLHRQYRDIDYKVKPAPLSLCFNDAFDLRSDELWCPPERNALKRLYDATKGNDWSKNVNWTDQYSEHCKWYGVDCSVASVPQYRYRYVITKLTLSDNGLSGSIPSEVGDLFFLEQLKLDRNRLIGRLPTEIFNLTHLQIFDVSRNTLSGEFPSNFATLPSLSHIFLSNNEFSGELSIPTTDESRIERLHIANNKFSGDISNALVQLRNLPYLQGADLSHNAFSGSMPSVALQGPSKLVLTGNERLISPIPSTLCHDPDVDLDLQDSPLHCPVIAFLELFYNWTNHGWDGLTTDSICDETSWHGIVCDESNTSIVEIKLANTGLRGTLPSSFGQHIAALALLRLLDLSHNALSGAIPLDFARLPFLEEVRLSHNNFGSTLPAQFSDLPRLKVLAVDNNHLNGTLPVEYGRLSSLRELRLSNNRISLPPSFASSYKQHGLSGRIPFEWGDLANIEHLDLSRNFLFGKIPRYLGGLNRMSRLYLHDNDFTGPIPIELGQLVAIKKLTLSGNGGLTKPAPLSICSRNDTSFDLGEDEDWCPSTRNSLKQLYDSTKGDSWTVQGSGDTSWVHEYSDYCHWHGVECEGNQSFGAVSHLHLMSNSLSGTIPADLFQSLTSLQSLLLGDNMLGGTISTHIGKLTKLATLHLGGNKLSGVVPEEINNLSNLFRVRLQANRFAGGFSNVQMRTTTDPVKLEFIADCGNPNDWYDDTPECDSCTTCCNSLGMCHDISRKAVLDVSDKAHWLTWTLLITAFFISGAFLVLCSFSVIIYFFRNSFPEVPLLRRDARHLCGEGSVYSFLLASFPTGRFVSIATVVVQSLVFLLFLYAADFGTESSDIRYTKRCPPNKSMDECESEDTRSAPGWLVFSFIVFVKIAPDLINGFTMTYLSGKWWNVRCFCSSAVLILVSLLAIWTSVFYNIAIATTNTELIINAVILLFVNEVDEMLFVVLNALLPQWTRKVIEDSKNFSTRLAMQHICNDSSENIQPSPVDVHLLTPNELVCTDKSSSEVSPSRANMRGHSHGSPMASASSQNLMEDDDVSSVSRPQVDVRVVDQITRCTKLELTVAYLMNRNEELERRNKALETKFCNLEKFVSKLNKRNQ